MHNFVCVLLLTEFELFSYKAGQETSKQALQEIVILPTLRPEVSPSLFLRTLA